MGRKGIVFKFSGLMFLIIFITVTVLLTLANWQMTGLFQSHVSQTSSVSENRLLASAHNSLGWVGVLILIFGLVASYLLARRVTDPLRRLSVAAEQIGSGKYETVIDVVRTDEVGQLADSLRAMSESLRTNRVMRQRLLTDIAHELKTPLAVIQGNLEGMIEDVVACDKEQLASLLEETVHLKRLINDLRDLSLAEAGQLVIERTPTDLNQLVGRVITLLQPLAEEKEMEIGLETETIPELLVDSGRIAQVVYNLLMNAIRYTQPGGRISVSTGIRQQSEGMVAVVCVADNGPGIPTTDLPFVFEHFYRVDTSRDRRSGGTGIGLAIVKQLVELHGGQVRAESHLGFGSSFHIQLPMQVPLSL